MTLTIRQKLAAALRIGRTVRIQGASLEWLDGKPALSDVELAAAFPIPQTVDLWQVRTVLGPERVAAVDAAIAAMPKERQWAVSNAWTSGNTIRRDSPTVIALAGILHLSAADVDAVFVAAEAITI